MEDTKIGNKEAIALLVTIAFNHIIMSVTKSITSLRKPFSSAVG